MCSSCGGGKASLRIPGATQRNPIVFGAANSAPSEPAEFLVEHEHAAAGKTKFVTGTGVQAAVEEGLIKRAGYQPRAAKVKRVAPTPVAHKWFVKIGRGNWKGHHSKQAAERMARVFGEPVLTYDEVLKAKGAR